jgi:hypothetical protein
MCKLQLTLKINKIKVSEMTGKYLLTCRKGGVPLAAGLSCKMGLFLDFVALNLNERESIETSVTVYQPTRRNISENMNFQRRVEKLQSKTSG